MTDSPTVPYWHLWSPATNSLLEWNGGLTTDQRGTGYPRVIGGTVDMGAYESDPATIRNHLNANCGTNFGP